MHFAGVSAEAFGFILLLAEKLDQQRPAYVPGAGSDPGTSCSADDATVARELFAESAAEYGSLAADAEQLRGQVVGLQRYVSTILAGQDAQTKVGD